MSEEKSTEKVSIALSNRDRKFMALCRSKIAETAAYQQGVQDATNALYQQYLALIAQDAGYQGGQLKLAEDDSALVEVEAPKRPDPVEPFKEVEPSK